MRRLIAGIRIARKIVSAPAFGPFRGEELRPGSEVESEDDLSAYIRRYGDTSFHPVGTCAIGTVVDERLSVLLEKLNAEDGPLDDLREYERVAFYGGTLQRLLDSRLAEKGAS